MSPMEENLRMRIFIWEGGTRKDAKNAKKKKWNLSVRGADHFFKSKRELCHDCPIRPCFSILGIELNILSMNHWLLKTEPESFSWGDLQKAGKATWDGVRNFQARSNLKE